MPRRHGIAPYVRGGKLAPVEYLKQLFPGVPRLFAVQGGSVDARDGGDVFGALHAALDLEGAYAGLRERVKLVYHGYIVSGEGEFIRSRPPAEHGGVLAAGLGAGAPVAAPFARHGGIKTAPGKAHAERAVAEEFKLHGAAFVHAADLLKRDLPCEHRAGYPQLLAVFEPAERVYAHLGGGVYVKLGQLLADERGKARVLNYYRVGVQARKLAREAEGVLKLPVEEQGVESDMRFYVPQAAEVDGLF